VAWSSENDAVFLKPVFDGGTPVAGLWYADLDSKTIKEFSVVRKLGLADFAIYPALDQIVGTTFRSEDLESGALGPSKIYLIDIPTGRSTVLQSDERTAFRGPLLSPDGSRLAFSFGGGEPDVWLVGTDGTDGGKRSFISGRPLAWTPDGRSLVVSRDNELQLVDVDTGGITTIARRSGKYQDPDFQGVEFIGIIKDYEQ
jgi:dipeptidyl aminopeptidase/acylaminoacyl peptidase